MAQNNLFMEDDDMRLYIDVQPLFIDELENSKNSAAASALLAAQSEEAARGWKNDIEDYKTGLELFYAGATDGITNSYNTAVSGLSAAKSLAINDLNTQKNSIQSSLNSSLNAAISSIRTNGQSYVNQAHDYAQEAQRTVDNRVSTDHLNQSKGLLTGSVSTDEEVLNDVKHYAHSTFDRSKFTVSGSPTITDDGIASGFSDGNYINVQLPTINTPATTNTILEIYGSFKVNSLPSSRGYIQGATIVNATQPALAVNQNGNLVFSLYGEAEIITTAPIDLNVNIDYKFILDETRYWKAYYKYATEESWTYVGQLAFGQAQATILTGSVYLGRSYANDLSFSTGSIDLKQFSITVDGVPVFSGNRTGIDTIKADDYTTVGTPTITDDGIASGFSSSNYLTKSLSSLLPSNINTVQINCTFKYQENSSVANIIYGGSGDNSSPRCFIATDGSIHFYLYDGTTVREMNLGLSSYNIVSGDIIETTFIFSNAKSDIYLTVNNNVIHYDKTTALSLNLASVLSTIYIGGWGSSSYSSSPIDLNSFKIYVDGDLVYQPCLKIPYTESKTGSKVVDAVYRERVKDMYEQFGYAPYYTLGSSDFTLPMGDIYGMIEKLRELIIQRTSQGS